MLWARIRWPTPGIILGWTSDILLLLWLLAVAIVVINRKRSHLTAFILSERTFWVW